jgi:nitroimidazol reductase NimA-like FMN-containing flavoprotein (pyridoxamine 5'-phosphate oxidase superfamily)
VNNTGTNSKPDFTRGMRGYVVLRRWKKVETLMNTEEMIRELHQPGATELLNSGPPLRLAYTGHDGYPRVIPIGFLWTGEQIVVCTIPGSPKVRAISAQPHVAITIDTGDTPATARSLLIRGYAELATVDGVPDEYIAAAAKTLTPSELEGFGQQVRSTYKQMARITIHPRWARFYDFGAGRFPRTLETALNG